MIELLFLNDMNSKQRLKSSPDFRRGLIDAKARLAYAQGCVYRKVATEFWQQCVRDISGKYDAYMTLKSKSGFNYFKGKQTSIDYKDNLDLKYLEANLRVRQKIYNELPKILNMDVVRFEKWLRTLHRAISYTHLYTGRYPRHVNTHTTIILKEIAPIAKKYNDPYWKFKSKGPVFEGISEQAQPRDIANDGVISHYYPELKYASEYLACILDTLKNIISSHPIGDKKYLNQVAYLYQLLVNLHLFVNVNSSLYMNIINALLEIAGIKGIRHGILDFVAMRLQPRNFQKYFINELKTQNINSKLNMPLAQASLIV